MDYTEWLHKLAVLGVGGDVAARYDALARAYAATTVYPNSDVIAYCRQLALDALLRADPMPATPEGAVEAENARRMVQLLDPERLRKRFEVS
jgi:hypothetical protein